MKKLTPLWADMSLNRMPKPDGDGDSAPNATPVSMLMRGSTQVGAKKPMSRSGMGGIVTVRSVAV